MVITIIIPVYNAEKYLRKCLDSVIAQTFTSWECILVNDGSSDNSGFICDEYASHNPKIRVIHKENGGVSSARNLGLTKTQSEWVTFLDADDYYTPDTLFNYTSCLRDNTDFVFVGWKSVTNNNHVNNIKQPSRQVIYVNKENAILSKFYNDTFHGFVWYGLFKLDIIQTNNIEFNKNITYNEDGLFLVEYLCHCKEIAINNQICYLYVQREGSAMQTIATEQFNEKYLSNIDARIGILDSITEYCSSDLLVEKAKDYLLQIYLRIESMARARGYASPLFDEYKAKVIDALGSSYFEQNYKRKKRQRSIKETKSKIKIGVKKLLRHFK